MITPVAQKVIDNNVIANKKSKHNNFGALPKLKIYDKLTDNLSHGFSKVYTKVPASQSAIEGMSKAFKKPAARMMDLASAVYTLSMLKNTASSKKIKKEQKPMLMINAVLVTIVSSTVAALIDHFTDPLMDKIKSSYKTFTNKLLEDGTHKINKYNGAFTPIKNGGYTWITHKDFSHGIDKMKSMSIFAMVVRFIIPLIMVPVTGGIVKKLRADKEAKLQQEKAATNKIQSQPTAQIKAQPQFLTK